jgi:peptidoglycan L-alanyl-D-glutamate endopeptidase CwlK
MSRALNDLDSRFRPKAFELIARFAEAGIAVLIVDTLRTKAEQEVNLATGVSSTMNSKHLPQPPEGKALAIDVVPYAVYQLTGPDKLQWNTADPVWAKMGVIGEALGLRWGGRWKKPHDPGHFEMVIK